MSVKLLFFPFSIIVLIWSFVSFTKPAWDEYQAQKVEVEKLTKEKAELDQGIANIKKALGEYMSLGEDVKTYVNNAMPVGGDNDNLVAELNKNAKQSGMFILNVDVKKGKASVNPKCKQKGAKKDGVDCTSPAVVTDISLSMLGGYATIKDFLNKIDTQNRIIVPKSMDLSVAKNAANDVEGEEAPADVTQLIDADITFSVFQKDNTADKSLSTSLKTDSVLKSLLSTGLDKGGLSAVHSFVTSQIFTPVQVEGAGKEDLFAENNQ